MTFEEATIAVEAMEVLPYFTAISPAARGLIADELTRMCENSQQAMWLIRQLSRLYGKWPGLREMRAAYCGKYKPADGIECTSEVYPDGIPKELPEPGVARLGERPLLALPEAAMASADPENEQLVTDLAEAKALPPMPKYRARSADEKRVDELLRRMHGEVVPEKPDA